MRICDSCGCNNVETGSNDDLWCSRCGNFLGFPVERHIHERRVAVRLVQAETSVAPGGEAVLAAFVRNGGDVVEKVRFTIEGSPTGWSLVEPAEVGLFPEQEAEVKISFKPPRSPQVGSGPTPFRLVATSQSDSAVVDRADGTVDVGSFVEVKASLNPYQSTGSSGADHHLLLENAGNTVADVAITGAQPGNDLALAIEPESFQLGAGARGEARVHVLPHEALYSAASKTHPFSVCVSAQGQEPLTVQAEHVQEAVVTAPTLVLAETRVRTAPGQQTTTTVTIRNRGRGGDDYLLELLGPAAAWGQVTPPVIALPSAGEVVAQIVFAPPLSPPVPASEIPFGVRCAAQADPRRSAAAEAVLAVEAVDEIAYEIGPGRVRRRWSSRHVMDIENRGNATIDLRPVLEDPQHDLSFAVSPSQLQIPAGGHDSVLVKARARRPKLLSKPVNRSFQASVVPAARGVHYGGLRGSDPRLVSYEQVCLLPRRLTALMIFVALVASVLGGALLMFGAQINQSL